MQTFYVDTCIYLNLWKKEVDEKGKQLCLFAKEFFEKAEKEEATIYYSGFLLKEIVFILSMKDYLEVLELFDSSPRFNRINLTTEEYKEAQRLKDTIISNLSFFDLLHILAAKKTNSILITRDKDIIEFAESLNVKAKKPEEAL